MFFIKILLEGFILAPFAWSHMCAFEQSWCVVVYVLHSMNMPFGEEDGKRPFAMPYVSNLGDVNQNKELTSIDNCRNVSCTTLEGETGIGFRQNTEELVISSLPPAFYFSSPFVEIDTQ